MNKLCTILLIILAIAIAYLLYKKLTSKDENYVSPLYNDIGPTAVDMSGEYMSIF